MAIRKEEIKGRKERRKQTSEVTDCKRKKLEEAGDEEGRVLINGYG